MCDQQRLRPACAYAQSDQSLCLSLEYSITIKLLTEHHFEFLSLKGGCTGSSESTLVRMPHCWKSHVAAHFPICTLIWKPELLISPVSSKDSDGPRYTHNLARTFDAGIHKIWKLVEAQTKIPVGYFRMSI